SLPHLQSPQLGARTAAHVAPRLPLLVATVLTRRFLSSPLFFTPIGKRPSRRQAKAATPARTVRLRWTPMRRLAGRPVARRSGTGGIGYPQASVRPPSSA